MKIEEALDKNKLKKIAKELESLARTDVKVRRVVDKLQKGQMPGKAEIKVLKKNDDVAMSFAKHLGPEQTMKIFEAKFSVDIDGFPRFYMDADTASDVKIKMRKLIKKASLLKGVDRTNDAKIRAALRNRISGKENLAGDEMEESLRKNIAQNSGRFPEGSTVMTKDGKKGRVMTVGKDFVKVAFGNKMKDYSPSSLSVASAKDKRLQKRQKSASQNKSFGNVRNRLAKEEEALDELRDNSNTYNMRGKKVAVKHYPDTGHYSVSVDGQSLGKYKSQREAMRAAAKKLYVQKEDITPAQKIKLKNLEKRAKSNPQAQKRLDALKQELGMVVDKKKSPAKPTPSKNARGSYDKADKNIIMQLRKAVDVKGNMDVEFHMGKTGRVSEKDAADALKLHDRLPPAGKRLLRIRLAKGGIAAVKQAADTWKKSGLKEEGGLQRIKHAHGQGYTSSSEKSQFGGHRAHLKDKNGKTTYLGSQAYKKKEHAKGEADAYHRAYFGHPSMRTNDKGARNAVADYRNKNKQHHYQKEQTYRDNRTETEKAQAEREKQRLGNKKKPGVKPTGVEEGNKKMKGKDPCWKGYEMVGTKKKGGKEVPNCVPEEVLRSILDSYFEEESIEMFISMLKENNVQAQEKDYTSVVEKYMSSKKKAKYEDTDLVDKSQALKKFKNRKDKDVDNDGDEDESDRFLHKRRKAIAKKEMQDEASCGSEPSKKKK